LAGPGILELLLEVSETFGHHAPSAKSGKLLILSHSYDGAAGAIGAGKRPGSAAGRSVCIYPVPGCPDGSGHAQPPNK
jgi:hypothetical protein